MTSTNYTLSGLSQLTAPTTSDEVMVLDVSDTTTPPAGPNGSNKRVTIGNILSLVPGGGGGGGGGGGSVPSLDIIWADDLTGVTNNGSTDCAGPVQTAINGKSGGACLVVFGIGTYLFDSAITLGENQGIAGMGSRVTNFTWSAAGPLFTATMATFNDAANAGSFTGFAINGPYGTVGTAGIKYGNLQGIRIDDVGFYGLDGGAVLGYAVGSSGWAEEAQITRADISECGATSGYVFNFDSTSFDYLRIDAIVVVEKNIDVISLTNSAELQGAEISIRGNLHGGSSNTGAVIALDRGNTNGQSYLTNATLAISMECNAGTGGGTVGHYLVYMGSSNAASQFSADGTLNAYASGATCQGWYNPNFLPAAFSGICNGLAGGAVSQGSALTVMGATRLTAAGDLFGTGTDIYWQFADVQTGLLANGSQTFAFHGADSFMISGTLYLKEPSSGTAPTVTFPGSFTSGGGTPTFASSGHTHKIECTYLPGETKWVLDYRGYY